MHIKTKQITWLFISLHNKDIGACHILINSYFKGLIVNFLEDTLSLDNKFREQAAGAVSESRGG